MNNAQLRYPAASLAILLHTSEAADIAAIVARLPTAPVLIKHPIHGLPNANSGLCVETKVLFECAKKKGRSRKVYLPSVCTKQWHNAAFV